MRFEQHKDGYINVDNKKYYISGFNFDWIKEFDLKIETFFDFGSENLGDSINIRQRYPNANIFAFEPSIILYDNTKQLADNYNILLTNIAISNIDGIVYYEEAKDKDNKTIGCGSIMNRTKKYKETFNDFTYLPKIEVPSKRLDTICKENNINDISLMHMDVEGAELLCLKGLGNIRPKAIFTEKCYAKDYYSGKGNYSYAQLKKYFAELNYTLVVETEVDALFLYEYKKSLHYCEECKENHFY